MNRAHLFFVSKNIVFRQYYFPETNITLHKLFFVRYDSPVYKNWNQKTEIQKPPKRIIFEIIFPVLLYDEKFTNCLTFYFSALETLLLQI